MARRRLALDPSLELVEVVAYQTDIEHALRLYFSPAAPTFESRFLGRSMREVSDELRLRLDEPKIGRRYDFASVHTMVGAVMSGFSFAL